MTSPWDESSSEWTLPWRTITIVFALALVAILVLAWRLRPADTEPDYFIVGDSVTYLSGGLIDNQFDRNHLQYVAKPSYSTSDLLPLVLEAMDQRGTPASKRETIALLVGYNDVRKRDLDSGSMPLMVEAASQFDCGVFLTLPARPGGDENWNELVPSGLVDAWNERLKAEVAKYPNLHVAKDWERVVTEAPADVMLDPDNLHPSDAGKRRLAIAYRTAVDRYCPVPEEGEE